MGGACEGKSLGNNLVKGNSGDGVVLIESNSGDVILGWDISEVILSVLEEDTSESNGLMSDSRLDVGEDGSERVICKDGGELGTIPSRFQSELGSSNNSTNRNGVDILMDKNNYFMGYKIIMSSTSRISIMILILLLITIIVYMLVLFETHKNNTFIFAPYTPPKNPPNNGFYPLGKITPLTQEQKDARNQIILSQLQKEQG